MTPRQQLRQLIGRSGYPMVPGAYDTLTARLVEAAGFAAVYLTGGGYSRASGYPDLGLLSLTENAMFIGRTVEAVGIPVIADADTGYGNAINVIRTVREYEKTGVAGFHIEDQVSPKKCGHYEGKEVIGRAEMGGKIKDAVDTRRGVKRRSPWSTPIWRLEPMSVLSRPRRRSTNCASSGAKCAGRRSSMSLRAARRRCSATRSWKRWASASGSIRHRPIAPQSAQRSAS